jgi:formyl-CoA transferase
MLSGVVPCAPILSMTEALAAPFTAERGMVAELQNPQGGSIRVVGSPVRSGAPADSRPGPTLGAQTEALLSEMGYSADRIAGLRASGIVS